MPRPNIKLFYFLFAILVILLTIIAVIPVGVRRIKEQTNNSPSPTTSPILETPGSLEPTPTIVIQEFTGVEEEILPETVANLVSQKQQLRYRTPITQANFTIDFDYSEDKFIVDLHEPKDQALREFENWIDDNYSSITPDQFIFR